MWRKTSMGEADGSECLYEPTQHAVADHSCCAEEKDIHGRLHRSKLSHHQTVGIVAPSMTISVPVIAEALSDAVKATSSATSSGRFGRPSGMPPSMSISFCRAAV